MKTYFKMSGHLEKPADLQKTILRTLIDAKLVKTLDADLRDSGAVTDLPKCWWHWIQFLTICIH